MARARRTIVAALAAGLVLAACGEDTTDELDVAAGWSVELVREDLDQPTQLALHADGERVLVAELSGEEGAGTGRVRDLGEGGTADLPLVLLEDLVVPTGLVAVDEATLLVQEGRDLVRWDLAAAGGPSRSVLVGDLPWNGRSQGTLTLLDDGRVLHSSTHEGTEPDLVPGSGAVYATPVDGTGAPELVAVGFKVPYAHAIGTDGRLWVTDIGDGRVDGQQVLEELHVFEGVDTTSPATGGWPLCTGRNRPVVEYGASQRACTDLPQPAAVFPPRSTPTGLAVTGDGRVLVSLFTTTTVRGGVVEVAPDGTVTDVVRGLETPQDLLPLPDGSFLLTTHLGGMLYRLTPP